MIALGPLAPELVLSLAALGGLWTVQGVIVARGAWDPLNRRFLFGLRVTMALFAGRALLILTGVEAFRLLVLGAAVLIPLAVMLLTEGLLRRHAPRFAKALVGGGTLVMAVVVLWPGTWGQSIGLMAFQVAGLVTAGWMVLRRDRGSLSTAENRAVGRLGLSMIVLIPLAATDFLMIEIGVPLRPSGLAVLFLCWLAVSLAREAVPHRAALAGLAVMLAAIVGAVGVLALLWGMAGDEVIVAGSVVAALVMLAVIVNDARGIGHEGQGLLHHLAATEGITAAGFLAGLQADPLFEGAVIVGPEVLGDIDNELLARVMAARPVLQRGAVVDDDAAGDLAAHLFDRFGATHLLWLGDRPVRLMALAVPAIAASPRMMLELAAVQRMAGLLQEAEGGGG